MVGLDDLISISNLNDSVIPAVGMVTGKGKVGETGPYINVSSELN